MVAGCCIAGRGYAEAFGDGIPTQTAAVSPAQLRRLKFASSSTSRPKSAPVNASMDASTSSTVTSGDEEEAGQRPTDTTRPRQLPYFAADSARLSAVSELDDQVATIPPCLVTQLSPLTVSAEHLLPDTVAVVEVEVKECEASRLSEEAAAVSSRSPSSRSSSSTSSSSSSSSSTSSSSSSSCSLAEDPAETHGEVVESLEQADESSSSASTSSSEEDADENEQEKDGESQSTSCSSSSESSSSNQSTSSASVRHLAVTSSQDCFASPAVTSSQGVNVAAAATSSDQSSSSPTTSTVDVPAMSDAGVESSKSSSPADEAATSSQPCSPEIPSPPDDVITRPVATVQAVVTTPPNQHVTLTVRSLKPIVVHDAAVHECILQPVSTATSTPALSAAVKAIPTTKFPSLPASTSVNTGLGVSLLLSANNFRQQKEFAIA